MDIEQSHQAVHHVLRAASLTARRPGQTAGDTDVGERATGSEDIDVYPRDLLQKARKLMLFAQDCPVFGEKYDTARGDEFLERPTSKEVFAAPERGVGGGDQTRIGGDVGQINEANRRLRIPLVHGPDGFRKLRAALPVDAGSVDPEPREVVGPRKTVNLAYFGAETRVVNCRTCTFKVGNFVVGLLDALPYVRQYSIAAVDGRR